MAHAVFTHRADSLYDDKPEERYHFPRRYLRAVSEALGDWIVYYEPRRNDGRSAYFATARLQAVEPDPVQSDHFYARVTGYLEFARAVPFQIGDQYFESALQKPDGSASKGMFGWSVRPIPPNEFDAILSMGLTTDPALLGLQQAAHTIDGFAEEDSEFLRPVVTQLTNRKFREAVFARQVKIAYQNRCAISGLSLRNGGGRPEVQAAHIQHVEHDGPDTVRNGLALSGTVHWMFDRGLISIDDDHSVLVAKDKTPSAMLDRLILPERRLILPADPRAKPHPTYLAWHRKEIFCG